MIRPASRFWTEAPSSCGAAPGKLSVLEELLKKQPVKGTLGLGHTRWATHGRPSEENAHPHTCCKDEIVVVHNGIIENYVELKKRLIEKGHRFKSQTDTEVLAHLIEEAYRREGSPGGRAPGA